MSIDRESSQGPAITIRGMGPWQFWARTWALGLSDEDAQALKDGTADAAQRTRAEAHFMMARNALIGADVGVPFGKPS